MDEKQHKDFLGVLLNVGDFVVSVSCNHNLAIYKIIDTTKKNDTSG